jgi:hypothetical protein
MLFVLNHLYLIKASTMKKATWYLFLFLPLLIAACAKENLVQETTFDEPATDRTQRCTPTQVSYDNENYFEDFGSGWWLPCLPELVTINTLYLREKGRYNVSASCNVNNNGTWEAILTATGDESGDTYTLEENDDYHSNYGFWDGELQRALVDRFSYDLTIRNETTGQVWENVTAKYKVVYNANGDIVQFEFSDFDCE